MIKRAAIPLVWFLVFCAIMTGLFLLARPTLVAAQDNCTCNVTIFNDVVAEFPDEWELDFETYMGQIVAALITGGITALAFWRREFMLYLISALTLVLFGLDFTDTNMSVGIMVVALGAYCAWQWLERLLGRAR